MIDVSVIIVNRNTKDLLVSAIKSVASSTVSKEIIVVDNASEDGSAEMVKKHFCDVILLQNASNEKFAKPNNDAVRIAKGRYYFLLNSDAQLCEKALDKLVKFMDQNPEIAIAGPQLLNPDGTIQPSCRGFITLWSHFCDMFVLDRLFPHSKLFASSLMTYFDHKNTKEVDHIMAAAVIIRPEVVKKIGLFDEKLSLHYNDLDFSLRVKKNGWKIVFYPEAKVIHHMGETTRKHNLKLELFDEMFSNLFYFVRKNYGPLNVLFFKILIILGFIPRTFYWYCRKLFADNQKVSEMSRFSIKSIRAASTLWKLNY